MIDIWYQSFINATFPLAMRLQIQAVFHGLSRFYSGILTGLIETKLALTDPSAAASWLSQGSNIPANISVINEPLPTQSPTVKDTNGCANPPDDNERAPFCSSHPSCVSRSIAHMWMINGMRNALEVLSLRFFLISRGWFAEWDGAYPKTVVKRQSSAAKRGLLVARGQPADAN